MLSSLAFINILEYYIRILGSAVNSDGIVGIIVCLSLFCYVASTCSYMWILQVGDCCTMKLSVGIVYYILFSMCPKTSFYLLWKEIFSRKYTVIGNGSEAELLLYPMPHSPIKEDALSPFIVLDSHVYLLVP
jgi:hypothetical protein